MPLVRKPPVIAPWPPTDPLAKPVSVRPRDGLTTIANNNSMTFKDLLMFNFLVDKDTQRLWAWYTNWYLREHVGCTRLTPGGNYRFSGGETIYVRKYLPPPRYKLQHETEVIRWFKKEILPLRTTGPGSLLHNAWRLIDIISGKEEIEATPIGLCAEATQFVLESFLQETTGDPRSNVIPLIAGKTLGQVVWNGILVGKNTMHPNHTANIICPDVGLKSYMRSDFVFDYRIHDDQVVDITPDAYNKKYYTWSKLKDCTVLDLHQKKVVKLDRWWRESAWNGPGRITIDTTRDRKHIES